MSCTIFLCLYVRPTLVLFGFLYCSHRRLPRNGADGLEGRDSGGGVVSRSYKVGTYLQSSPS